MAICPNCLEPIDYLLAETEVLLVEGFSLKGTGEASWEEIGYEPIGDHTVYSCPECHETISETLIGAINFLKLQV